MCVAAAPDGYTCKGDPSLDRVKGAVAAFDRAARGFVRVAVIVRASTSENAATQAAALQTPTPARG
jgi:hypothetical protein